MEERNKDSDAVDQTATRDEQISKGDAATKPAATEVGPPGQRVDDETGTDETKRARRQE